MVCAKLDHNILLIFHNSPWQSDGHTAFHFISEVPTLSLEENEFVIPDRRKTAMLILTTVRTQAFPLVLSDFSKRLCQFTAISFFFILIDLILKFHCSSLRSWASYVTLLNFLWVRLNIPKFTDAIVQTCVYLHNDNYEHSSFLWTTSFGSTVWNFVLIRL